MWLINSSSLRRVKHLIKTHKTSLVALLEPKSTRTTISDFQSKLHCSDSVANDAGTIWILWKSDLSCSVISSEAQQITLSCNHMGLNFILSCIYASYNVEIRKQLWNSLLQPGYTIPWMEIGDYNVVRS